jgi:DNA-binding transcriptional LysR family regulator
MELIWLEDFLALAEHLNFSRAADARNVTQPAFSRRIRALEAWLGTQLSERSTHHVSLTPAGEHFRQEATVLVRGLHQLRRDTRGIADRRSQGLSLAATHALSFTFFPTWIRSHPDMLSLGKISLISDSMQACEHLMLHGDAQFLLCHHHPDVPNRLSPQEFASVAVGFDTLVPLSASDSQGQPLWRLDGGGRRKYLAYSEQSGLGRILAAKPEVQDRLAGVDRSFTSHLAATLLSMACAGEGMAWLPQTLALEDIAAGRLVVVGGEMQRIPIEIRLFRPLTRQTPAVEAVWTSVTRTARGA